MTIHYLAFALAYIRFADAFSSIGSFAVAPSHRPALFAIRQDRERTSTRLNVGAELDPDDVIPLGREANITPEGFGFSSPMTRILKEAKREGGYYRATATESVTDVMDGITQNVVDVALVFDDASNKLLGIFTETDYIKV